MKSALRNRAFTLFELIIVVILIGLIYGVFVNKLSTRSTQKSEISLKEVREFLNDFAFKQSVQIVCENDSQECSIYIDDKKTEQTIKLFKSKPVVYTLDETGRPKIIKFSPVFEKEGKIKDVFFKFKIFKNGSGDSYIVESEDIFYVFKAIEKKPYVLTRFDEATEQLDHIKILPILVSDYQYQ